LRAAGHRGALIVTEWKITIRAIFTLSSATAKSRLNSGQIGARSYLN